MMLFTSGEVEEAFQRDAPKLLVRKHFRSMAGHLLVTLAAFLLLPLVWPLEPSDRWLQRLALGAGVLKVRKVTEPAPSLVAVYGAICMQSPARAGAGAAADPHHHPVSAVSALENRHLDSNPHILRHNIFGGGHNAVHAPAEQGA
jgi:hypothetical protein